MGFQKARSRYSLYTVGPNVGSMYIYIQIYMCIYIYIHVYTLGTLGIETQKVIKSQTAAKKKAKRPYACSRGADGSWRRSGPCAAERPRLLWLLLGTLGSI